MSPNNVSRCTLGGWQLSCGRLGRGVSCTVAPPTPEELGSAYVTAPFSAHEPAPLLGGPDRPLALGSSPWGVQTPPPSTWIQPLGGPDPPSRTPNYVTCCPPPRRQNPELPDPVGPIHPLPTPAWPLSHSCRDAKRVNGMHIC
eukprot:9497199-Pyramimonas_sp.AAC.1